MTKGKYAARSALRREDAEVQTELAAGRRHIVRLTEQVRALEGRLAEEKRARKAEVNRMAAMLDERVSPEILALRKALEEQRDLARKAEAAAQRTKRIQTAIMRRLRVLLQDGLGFTEVESWEALMSLANGEEETQAVLVTEHAGIDGKMSREALIRVQAARGQRSRSDVVQLLHDKIAALDKASREASAT